MHTYGKIGGMTLSAVYTKPIDLLQWTTHDEARFAARIDPDGPDGCHLWTGPTRKDGYGYFFWQGSPNWRVHRLAFALANGEIDPALTIDHLCQVRLCVNPAHMEQISLRENGLRGNSWVNGTCSRGHDLRESAYPCRRDNGGLHWYCKVCYRERARERRHLIRDAKNKLGLSTSAYVAQYGRSKETALAILGRA